MLIITIKEICRKNPCLTMINAVKHEQPTCKNEVHYQFVNKNNCIVLILNNPIHSSLIQTQIHSFFSEKHNNYI